MSKSLSCFKVWKSFTVSSLLSVSGKYDHGILAVSEEVLKIVLQASMFREMLKKWHSCMFQVNMIMVY